MTTYAEAIVKLGNRSRRKLENNTYLEKRTGAIAVKLHHTDVVTYFPCGKIRLNSGGWNTVTTKDRINKYSPLSIHQHKYTWYLSPARIAIFSDGMVVDSTGTVICS